MTSIFNKLYSLYFRPSQFFSDTNLLQKRWLIFLATAFYSVTGVFERIEQKVIRYDMVNIPESKEALLNTIVTSWFVFWSVSLVIGLLFAWLIWWIGGWFYNLRIKWCGAREFDKDLGRSIYVISNMVYALPATIGMLVVTLCYNDYLNFYTEDFILSIVVVIFVLWSLIVSYKAVSTNFKVKKWLAIWWFMIAPIILNITILFFYVFASLYVK
ncbi:YIP1 family protein [Shewanella sp. H8]|uniref:YIP1 family protein n=1 Tax=Shewanella sp. H8 TaxID=3342676 RepID=UPI0033156F97